MDVLQPHHHNSSVAAAMVMIIVKIIARNRVANKITSDSSETALLTR